MGGGSIKRQSKPFVSVKQLCFSFPGSSSQLLHNLSFNIYPNEIIAMVGPSGVGKTTLLRLITGLIRPTKGEIQINKNISGQKGKIGLVFQHHAAFPWLSVEQNINFALNIQKMPKNQREKMANMLLETTGLFRHRKLFPNTLSGGQEQRLAIARTLALQPSLLLLDEPFSSLDIITREQLQQFIQELHDKFKLTTMVATHDIEDALYLADRIIVMKNNPAKISAIINNSFQKPRNKDIKLTPKFQNEKYKIMQLLKPKNVSESKELKEIFLH